MVQIMFQEDDQGVPIVKWRMSRLINHRESLRYKTKGAGVARWWWWWLARAHVGWPGWAAASSTFLQLDAPLLLALLLAPLLLVQIHNLNYTDALMRRRLLNISTSGCADLQLYAQMYLMMHPLYERTFYIFTPKCTLAYTWNSATCANTRCKLNVHQDVPLMYNYTYECTAQLSDA